MTKILNFPETTTVGTQHTVGERSWEWDGKGWKSIDTPISGPSFTKSSSKPSSPKDGDKWEDTNTDRTYTYLESEGVWVEL